MGSDQYLVFLLQLSDEKCSNENKISTKIEEAEHLADTGMNELTHN